MKWLRKIRFKFGALSGRGKFDAEMDAEMRTHLELRIERNLGAGMSAEEARYAAQRDFGGLDQLKEKAREQRGGIWLGHLIQDLRYGLRLLRKSPGFTATAVLTLALGIGACSTVFSVIDAVVLHPFSYPKLDRLMAVHGVVTSNGFQGRVSPADFFDYRRQSTSFSDLAMSTSLGTNFVIGKEPIRLYTEYVTANLFTTLGVRPILGRNFRPEEEVRGNGHVIILSYNTWQEQFAGHPDIIGQTVLMDDQVATIIGVMPADFQTFGSSLYGPALYMPIQDRSSLQQNRYWRNFQVVGRLKDDATRAQASSELAVIARSLAQQYPATDKGWGTLVVPLLDDTVAYARPLLFTLLGAVGFLLLIACANIANLLLARAASRQKEMVLRTALGASRSRIVRQLLCESLLLGLLGGALGVLLAHWSIKLVPSILPVDSPGGGNIAVDGRTLIFTCAVVLLTGIGCGLAPALQAARIDLNHALKDSGRGNSAGKPGLRLRGLFVISEISLAIVLLTGAGLLVRSFLAFQNADQGYQPRDLYFAPLSLTQKKYEIPQNQISFVDQVLEKLSHLHGVSSATFAVGGLFSNLSREFAIAGQPVAPAGLGPITGFQVVTPDYFKTLGIPLLRGRPFSVRDATGTPLVVLINQAFARKFFPDKSPIGQRLNLALDDVTPAEPREIVGVVGTVVDLGGSGDYIPDQVYIPYKQHPFGNLSLGIRTIPGVPINLRAITDAVHSVEPAVPLTAMFGMFGFTEFQDRGTPGVRRLSMVLSTAFSGVALLLATIGIYGVMAYNVAQRTGEIGVRMALGAQRGDVLRLIMTSGARLICLGILFGLAGALAGARVLGTLLYNVGPYDLMTLGGITVAISASGLIACLLPALRATKVSPMVALRSE